jgi:hypothetical protein
MEGKADDDQGAARSRVAEIPAEHEQHLEAALRRYVLGKMRAAAVFVGGSVAGAGGATVAQQGLAPAAAVAPASTTAPSAPAAVEQVDVELACVQARRDARAAIDYFAELADSCELPRHARPKIRQPTQDSRDLDP